MQILDFFFLSMSAKVPSQKIESISGRYSATESPSSELESIIIQRNQKGENSKHSKMHQDLFSAELSISDEKYFDESFGEILDNTTEFNLNIFLEISFYHILFFTILGPLASFLIYLKNKNLILARNLGFWGISGNLMFQTFIFFVNFIGIFGYAYFKVQIISPLEIFMLFGGCVCRSFVIAIKYALFPKKKMNYVKYRLLTNDEIGSEFLLKWLNQEDQMVEQELMSTMMRNNIDEDLFMFFFLRPLKPELKEALKKTTVWEQNYRKDRERSKATQLFGSEGAIYGYNILRFLINENSKRMTAKTIYYVSFLLSVLHAIIPLVYRVGVNSTLFGTNHTDKIIGVCVFLGTIFFYFFNFLFIMIGVFEYQRLVHLLSQLSNFLATKNVETYHTKKIFPTINIFCILSFRSWFSLNIMVRDYGKKYQKRVDMYLAVFLLYYLVVGFICIISIFDLIIRFPTIYYIELGFEMLVYFAIVFIVLFKGVVINDHYLIHESLLTQLKQIIVDFISFDKLYFQNEFYTPNNEVYLLGKNRIDHILNIYYKKDDIRTPPELRESYFKTLLSINKFVTSQLTLEKLNRPFKVLGIPATSATVQSLLAGIGTVATVAFNKLYKE